MTNATNEATWAALLTNDGDVVTGVNIENASYGLTICAERTAVFKAVSDGARQVTAIAIVSSGGQATWPCGGCRQVLHEFGPKMRIITRGQDGLLVQRTLAQLLPHAFGPTDITG